MRKLILVRHSESQPDAKLPPADWVLSPVGRQRCEPLAKRLAGYDPPVLLSSKEQKAIETAQRVGRILQKPYRAVAGLGEHERSGEPYHDQETFLRLVELLLTRPEDRVFGKETGAGAQARFEAAIARILMEQPTGNVAAVVHGTVLSLFVAAHSELVAYSFWKQLGQPAIVIFSLPQLSLLEVIFALGEA